MSLCSGIKNSVYSSTLTLQKQSDCWALMFDKEPCVIPTISIDANRFGLDENKSSYTLVSSPIRCLLKCFSCNKM